MSGAYRRAAARLEKEKAAQEKRKKSAAKAVKAVQKTKYGGPSRSDLMKKNPAKRKSFVPMLKKRVKIHLKKEKMGEATERTKTISKELRKNLSPAEIKRLRGGK